MATATHSLVVLAPRSGFDDFAAIETLLADHGVSTGEGRVLPVPRSMTDRRSCHVLALHGPVDPGALAPALDHLGSELQVDLVLQASEIRHADYRLAVFDMDSTLIECEVIDELARRHGVGDEVAAVTERAMRGELDFNQSFSERVARLAGLDTAVIAEIADQLPLTEGVCELLLTLRAQGIYTAILSGGFVPFARQLQTLLGFDEIHANPLDAEGGRLTGKVVAPIVNGERKAALLEQLRLARGLSRDQVIAVGDGANDLPMLASAGMGVAYRAKPVVRARAAFNIRHVGLDGITCLLGAGSERDPGRP